MAAYVDVGFWSAGYGDGDPNPAGIYVTAGYWTAGYVIGDTTATAGGGYDDDDKKTKRKRRFVVERDGKLLVFASAAAAVQSMGEAAEPVTPVEVEVAPELVPEVAPAAQETAAVDYAVDLAAMREWARIAGLIEAYNAAYRAQHFERLLALFQRMQDDARDEEDVEMLLLSL